MNVFRSAMVFSLMASASPLAAQSTLSDRPGSWVPVQPASRPQGQVLSAPQAAPLLTAEPSGGVLLEVRDGGQAAILSTPDFGGPVLETPEAVTEEPGPRPTPRPADLEVPELVAVVEEDAAAAAPEIAPVEIVTTYTGPRPSQRPREVAGLAGTVPTAARALVTVAPSQAPDVADEVLEAAVAEPAPVGPPALAPTPTAADSVAAMSMRHLPANRSAIALPSPITLARAVAQPAAFATPPRDLGPVLSRPLPDGPDLVEEIAALSPAFSAPLSAVLVPAISAAPSRAIQPGVSVAPLPGRFPMSALPPGVLPGGPESLSFIREPSPVLPVAMAAVLIGERTPAPIRVARITLPDMPVVDEPPRDPEAGPVLPDPDEVVLARVITEAEICWQFAELHGDAAWASLSVEVALDEMNMPTLESVRLTGFAHAVSSSAAEAFDAARGALAACAEATSAEPATAAATFVFDREGVRLR